MRHKSLYTNPCNRCGLCCSSSLCPAAEMAFPDSMAPCPALAFVGDEAECGLVVIERHFTGDKMITKALGIGRGCSMADASTTDEQIEKFNTL